METFNFLYLNKSTYSDVLRIQQKLHDANIKAKEYGKKTNNYLIFLQHNPVYTLGKSGDINNLIVPVEKCGAEFHKTNRGGDITFHGPGQLVGYPIFDLESFGIGVRNYVELLEDCIMELCLDYGVQTGRIHGASGVWVDAEGDGPRKICALGIKISRGISMHGFAFNISTDLSYFDNIVPCGIDDKGVTSLAKETGLDVEVQDVVPRLLEIFGNKFVLRKKERELALC